MLSSRDYTCPRCGHYNHNSIHLQRHYLRNHYCYRCNSQVFDKRLHDCSQIGRGLGFDPAPFTLVAKSLQNSFQNFLLKVDSQIVTVENLIRTYESDFVNLFENVLRVFRSVKVRVVIEALLHQNFTSDEVAVYLSSQTELLLHRSGIKRLLFLTASAIIRNLNIFAQNGSSWSVHALNEINVNIAKYRPFTVGYFHILPENIESRYGFINIPTDHENLCFVYCVIAVYLKMKTKREGETLSNYKAFMLENYNEQTKTFTHINFSCIPQNGAVTMELVKEFERDNPNFSVNIFEYSSREDEVYPIKIIDEEKDYHVDLLMIYETGDKHHFVLIHDFNLFMKRKGCAKRHYCKKCLFNFANVYALKYHSRACQKLPLQLISFPVKQFVNYELGADGIPVSNYVIADFETWASMTGKNSSLGKSSMITGHHKPLSYAFAYLAGRDVEFFKYFDGADCDKDFVLELLLLADVHLKQVSAYAKVMRMTHEDWRDYVTSDTCCICKQPLGMLVKNESGAVEYIRDDADLIDVDEDMYVYPPPSKRKVMGHHTVRHHHHGTDGSFHEPARYVGMKNLTSKKPVILVYGV
jgi:hypothetical protein